MNIMEQLKAPFKPEEIHWRIGRKSKDKTKATVLAYIDSRAIQNRLDEVVGAENWTVEYTPINLGEMTRTGFDGNTSQVPLKGFMCTIKVTRQDENFYLIRSDGANVTDFEPIKGGLSDAFKRAAAAIGIGRYLYDLKETWVDIDKWGNFTPPNLPLWALPKGYVQQPVPEVKQTAEAPTANEGEAPTDGAVTFTRGKYKGVVISTLMDKGYLKWAMESNFPQDIKDACQARLAELG